MANTDVEYYINGVNFKDYGVYVSASNGITSKLAIKDRELIDWRDYNGYMVSGDVKFKERVIELDCFIEATGYNQFLTRFRSFSAQFERNGTQRLKIDVGEKPLVYEVMSVSDFNVSKKWSDAQMVGTFKLKLVEFEPVKRVIKYTGTNASITVTSSKLLNVYWGDGSYTYDVYGTNKTITHAYSTSGTYEIIITGNIDEITGFSTNGELIWSKLQ